MLIFWLLACSDPDFGHVGDALEAYDRGWLAMQQGNAAEAVTAFSTAASLDSERPVLHSWEALALVEAGQSDRALARLNAALTRFPTDAVLRYQRAAILSRRGDLSGTAADLRWLYANEKANPIEVGEDPDFLPLRTDPLYADLVPRAQVEASVTGEDGSVLVGDLYTVNFFITSRTGTPVRIQSRGSPTPSLVLERLVEDMTHRDEIWTKRRLYAEFRAVSAGRMAAGPWQVEAGKSSTLTERLVVDVVSLPGRTEHQKLEPIHLVMPSVRWGASPEPFLGHRSDGDWAVYPSMMYFTPQSILRGPRMEYREYGQPQWLAVQVEADSRGEIRNGGTVVLRWR
jgi:hypothetical protein